MNDIKGIENKRASFAYDCAMKGNGKEFKSEYKSYTKKIPMYIKTNGLGATLAFVKSKFPKEKNSVNAWKVIYDQITIWIREYRYYLLKLETNDDLVKKVIELNSQEYRAVTIEILSLFNWIKRFADGLED